MNVIQLAGKDLEIGGVTRRPPSDPSNVQPRDILHHHTAEHRVRDDRSGDESVLECLVCDDDDKVVIRKVG